MMKRLPLPELQTLFAYNFDNLWLQFGFEFIKRFVPVARENVSSLCLGNLVVGASSNFCCKHQPQVLLNNHHLWGKSLSPL